MTKQLELTEVALAEVLSRVPRQKIGTQTDFETLVGRSLPELNVANGPWLAGGAVRRLFLGQPLDSDFDVFFKNVRQLQEARDHLRDIGFKNRRASETAEEWTGSVDGFEEEVVIQLIHFDFFDDVAQLLSTFDYTLCQVAFAQGKIYAPPSALIDILRKRIVVANIEYPHASLRRLLKYSKQGFYACGGCLDDILRNVTERPYLLSNSFSYID